MATRTYPCFRLSRKLAIEKLLLWSPRSQIVHITVGTSYCTSPVKHREPVFNMQSVALSTPKQGEHFYSMLSRRRESPEMSCVLECAMWSPGIHMSKGSVRQVARHLHRTSRGACVTSLDLVFPWYFLRSCCLTLSTIQATAMLSSLKCL